MFNFSKLFAHSVLVNAECLLLLVLWWLVVIGKISHVTFLIQPRKHEKVSFPDAQTQSSAALAEG